MRRFGFPAVCALLLLLSTERATGDGGPFPESYALPGYKPRDWSGFYGGVQGGWLWGQFEFLEIESGFRFPAIVQLTQDSNGFTVGGVLGFGQQDESWVYGGEIDLAFTDFSGEVITPANNRLKKELNFVGSIRGRVGYSFDRILPYVTAGVAFGNADLEVFEGRAPSATISDNQTAIGYAIGAGLEFALGEKWSAGIEYRFTHLSKTLIENDIIDSNIQFPGSNQFSTVQARLVWRFGQ